jgi:hypothetical protein
VSLTCGFADSERLGELSTALFGRVRRSPHGILRVISLPADYRALAASLRRYLRASTKSPRTAETYGEAVDQLGEWLSDHDDAPRDHGELTRAHIEAFLIHLFRRRQVGRRIEQPLPVAAPVL